MTVPFGLHEEFLGSALRAITADGEEDIDATADQILHRPCRIHRTARSAQNRAGLQMNSIHHLVGENEGFGAVFRIQPLISPAKAEHVFYAVGVMHFKKQRPDDVVESGAQSSASDNACASFRWIEEQMLARARQFKEEVILRRRINGPKDYGGNPFRLTHPAFQRRRKARGT